MNNLNIEIVSKLKREYVIKKQTPDIDLSKIPASAIAAATAAMKAAINDRVLSSICEGMEEVSANHVASNMLKLEWSLSETEIDARLQQIRDANPGEWKHIAMAQLWNFVLAGLTFDDEGKLEPKSLSFFRWNG